MTSLNSIGAINNAGSIGCKLNNQTPEKLSESMILGKSPLGRDVFEISNKTEDLIPPEIGVIRLGTGFLTDEQIAQINKTRKLPDNAKFVPNGIGQYRIVNNFINLTVGTQTLPEGFEVKKNILGQAVVLPKGSDGLFIK